MAAENWLGINLGDILAQTEQIKNAQQTRAYNEIKIQQAQQERADELAKRDAYRQLFTPPTAGDVTGASNFATTGYNPAGLQALGDIDPEARLKIQEHFSKMSADQRELEGKKYIAAAPLALKASKMPYETRKSFIAAASPYLQSQGWTQQEIAAFDPTDQNIQALGTIAMTAPQVLDSMKIEWHQQGENPSFATDSMGNPVGVGNPYVGSAVGASVPAGKGAVALAGNNPGGIIDSPFAKSQPGYQGANGRYAKFDTLQNGITAQTNLLQSYIARGFDTPAKIAARWAPAGDGANNPAQYAANVAKQMGIGVNDKIGPGQVAAFQQAQATQENAMYPQAQAGGLPTTAAPGFIPGTPKQKPKYEWVSETERKSLKLPPGQYQKSPEGKIEPVSGSQTVELDDQGLDYAAAEYMQSGHMPSLGMKSAEARAQVIGRAAQMARDAGLSPQQAAGLHADFRANATALSSLQRTANQVLAFERTASLNADQVLATMGKGEAGTGVPILNAWVQASRRGIKGSADVARFDTAIKGFSSEYAKVLTSNGASGSVTDTAQAETAKLINAAQNPGQMRAVIQQAKIEMGNRRTGFVDQSNALRQLLGAQKPTPTATGKPDPLGIR